MINYNNVKAIILVHYFGQPQELQLFHELCQENNIILIEDNAHGHGGHINGKPLGTFGDLGFSSPRKLSNLLYGGILYYDDRYIKNYTGLLDYKPYNAINLNTIRNCLNTIFFNMNLKSF